MSEPIKVGLVLSGGGAKGAYQVGVLKALRDMGTQVDVIAGASIGALNGGVLASAPSLDQGIERMEKLWLTLAETSPLSMKMPSYLTLLLAAGLRMNGVGALDGLIRIAKMAAARAGIQLPPALDSFDSGVLCDKPLQALVDRYFDPGSLASGIPLYVSVFKSNGGAADIISTITAEFGFGDTSDSEFLHLQSLPLAQQKDALLASAAIPMLFAPRQVNGSLYTDGGQGGWQKMQGNTPITPLLEAGCNLVIVTHLSDGSLWSRRDFPKATILEIRPGSTIARDEGAFGGAKDLLGFDPVKIPSWIEQGYQDTVRCVGRVAKAGLARQGLLRSEGALKASEERNQDSDNSLADAMARLSVRTTHLPDPNA